MGAAHDDLPHAVVHGDVGAAEAIDGLLGIADQGEGALAQGDLVPAGGGGVALAEEEDDLGLQRVGVLELVDEDMVEEALELAADAAVPGQEVAEPDQQIELVQHLAPGLDLLVERDDDGEEAGQARGHPAVQRGAQGGEDGVVYQLPGLPCDVVAAEPLTLFEVLRQGGHRTAYVAEQDGRVVNRTEGSQPLGGVSDPSCAVGWALDRRCYADEISRGSVEGGRVKGRGLGIRRTDVA